ncbi:MAG: hypothetical protein ACRDQA_11250 [Nocardioidaceae bacterium]
MTDSPANADSPARRNIPVAATVCLLEALVVAGMAVAELVHVDADHPSVAITTAVFFMLYAVGLGFSASALLRLKSWSRGPVVLAQLIELGVAWSFKGNDTTWVSIVLAVPALVVLGVMFSPSTTKALYGERESDRFLKGPDQRGRDQPGPDDSGSDDSGPEKHGPSQSNKKPRGS